MKLVSFLIVLCIFISCSDDKDITSYESQPINYVQGQVVFGLKDSVTLINIADYIYSLDNISIIEIVSFQYISSLPIDSIQIINTTFESKSYIWEGTTRTSYIDNETKIFVEFWIKDFTEEDIMDWKLLKERFQLNHSPYYFQSGVLNVEVGKEKEWVSNLSNLDLFRYVELNGITHTHLFRETPNVIKD
ncbi:hypothetical protein MNBD_IGNAVI01-1402 [hydrothermal vent metagenome]|uniref:Uncharacterized protein n=1 Tax=hydrothermal vent metagenome TaxID=652676 RepID=A0A3B1CXX2_9ZZZZ